MNEQIVAITDLKEYDNQIREWLPKNYIQVGGDNTITKPKISIVDNLPATPDPNTVYFCTSGTPPTPTPTLSLSLEGVQVKTNEVVSAQVVVTSDKTWNFSSNGLSGCTVTRSGNILTISMAMFNGTKGSNREFKITVTTDDGTESKWVSFVQQASYLVCSPDGGTIEDNVLQYNAKSIFVDTNLSWAITTTNVPTGCSITKIDDYHADVIMPKYLSTKNATRSMTFDIKSAGDLVIKSFTVVQNAVYIVPSITAASISKDFHTKLQIGTIDCNDGYKIVNNDTSKPITMYGLDNDKNIYCDAEENTGSSERSATFHILNDDGTLNAGNTTITQAGRGADTYSVSPSSLHFTGSQSGPSAEKSVKVINSSGVAQPITSATLSGTYASKFNVRTDGTNVYVYPEEKTYFNEYNVVLNITANTTDGSKTLTANITQTTTLAYIYIQNKLSLPINIYYQGQGTGKPSVSVGPNGNATIPAEESGTTFTNPVCAFAGVQFSTAPNTISMDGRTSGAKIKETDYSGKYEFSSYSKVYYVDDTIIIQ